MALKTCLLVTDDPDDHLEFSEALYEISTDTILLSISHAMKAIDLLTLKLHVPDYIFLDLAMTGKDTDMFLKAIKSDEELEHIPLIAYGEYTDLNKIEAAGILHFLDRDVTYSGLRNFLANTVIG